MTDDDVSREVPEVPLWKVVLHLLTASPAVGVVVLTTSLVAGVVVAIRAAWRVAEWVLPSGAAGDTDE